MVCWQMVAALGCFLGGAEPAQMPPDPGTSVPPPLPVPMPVPTVGGFNEYCQHIADHLERDMQQRPAPPTEVGDLVQQGRQACAAGHIRSGMHWLRIARTMLQEN